MTATALSPARALREPRRLDLRAIFGIFLTVLALLGSIAYWSLTADTRAVLVATRNLPVGATLGADDLAAARVRVDDGIYAAAVPATELDSLVGRQLAEPVHAQQLLARAQVSSRPPLGAGQLAMTIAVSPEAAAGGRVRPGDAVQVLVTTNKGKPEAKTVVVLPRVTVYDVGYDQRLTVVGTTGPGDSAEHPAPSGPLKSITLIVDQDQALKLGQAKWGGDLDVALLPAQP